MKRVEAQYRRVRSRIFRSAAWSYLGSWEGTFGFPISVGPHTMTYVEERRLP